MRAASGVVAAGLVLLTAVVIASAVIGAYRGFPGPGAVSVTTHVAASAVSLIAQRVADRRRGALSLSASLAVVLVAAIVLYTQWWS